MSSWWTTDQYTDPSILAGDIQLYEGPHGPAVVKAWSNGSTSSGWGRPGPDNPGFMANYTKGRFNLSDGLIKGYDRGVWALALVMRSVRLVVVDIDGKNGGDEGVKSLYLDRFPTLAEVSKSGTGYHLFYSVPEDWDDVEGYGLLHDHIGIEKGVDIKAVGCVYHYPQQRWNNREIQQLPQHLFDRLMSRTRQESLFSKQIARHKSGDMDETEWLMLTDELKKELDKPIREGKRNLTLYALGSKLQEADVEDWEDLIRDKGREIFLDDDEVEKIIENVHSYA